MQLSNFNPRSREGSDEYRIQSVETTFDFNPRSREGSDMISSAAMRNIGISIHAPVKGAT